MRHEGAGADHVVRKVGTVGGLAGGRAGDCEKLAEAVSGRLEAFAQGTESERETVSGGGESAAIFGGKSGAGQQFGPPEHSAGHARPGHGLVEFEDRAADLTAFDCGSG